MLYVLSRTLAGGKREGIVSSLGTFFGGMVHVVAAAAGLRKTRRSWYLPWTSNAQLSPWRCRSATLARVISTVRSTCSPSSPSNARLRRWQTPATGEECWVDKTDPAHAESGPGHRQISDGKGPDL